MPKRTQARILFNQPEIGFTEIIENPTAKSPKLRKAIDVAYKAFWKAYKQRKNK